MDHLFQIGFSITGFTALVLLMKNENNRQSRYSVLLLILWFTRFLVLFLKDKINLYDFPFLVVSDQSLLLLDGVLFYWYVKSLSNPLKLKNQFLHIIPFLISIGFSIMTVFMVGKTEIVDQFYEINSIRNEGDIEASGLDVLVFLLIVIFINGFYVFRSIGLLKKYDGLLTDNYSNLLNLRISWLKKITYFWLIFSFIPLVLFSFSYIFRTIQFEAFETIFLGGLWATAIFFSTNVISQRYSNEETLFKAPTTPVKNKSNEEIEEVFTKLTQYIEKNETFKDAKLTLHSLATQLEIKPAKLSVAINSKNETNFHEFINTYRIEAVKTELINTDEQIIIIAYKNGFNSKSTFNSAFKKMTGMTPSQFRKTSNPSK